jgi:hypothetical protein
MPAVLQRLMRHSAIQTTMGFYVELNAADVAEELWAKFGASKGNSPAQGSTLGNSDPKNASGPGQAERVRSNRAIG